MAKASCAVLILPFSIVDAAVEKSGVYPESAIASIGSESDVSRLCHECLPALVTALFLGPL